MQYVLNGQINMDQQDVHNSTFYSKVFLMQQRMKPIKINYDYCMLLFLSRWNSRIALESAESSVLVSAEQSTDRCEWVGESELQFLLLYTMKMLFCVVKSLNILNFPVAWSDLGSIPSTVNRLSSLEVLSLSGNNLSGKKISGSLTAVYFMI